MENSFDSIQHLSMLPLPRYLHAVLQPSVSHSFLLTTCSRSLLE